MNKMTRFESLRGTRQEPLTFRKWQLFDKHLEIMLPDIFEPMSEQNVVLYYPREERPEVLLSDDSGKYQCSFKHLSGVTSKRQDMDEIGFSVREMVEENQPMQDVSAAYSSLSTELMLKWFTIQIKLKKREYEQLEFMFPLQSHLLIGSFIYPREEALKWYAIKAEVFNSIQCI